MRDRGEWGEEINFVQKAETPGKIFIQKESFGDILKKNRLFPTSWAG